MPPKTTENAQHIPVFEVTQKEFDGLSADDKATLRYRVVDDAPLPLPLHVNKSEAAEGAP